MSDAISNGLALRESIRNATDTVIGGTLGRFVAADPNNIPENLRPFQAGYRRTCDIYAQTGAIGQGLLGPALGSLCDPYLGSQAPRYNPDSVPSTAGGQCAVLYNFTVTLRDTNFGSPSTQSGQALGPFRWSRTPTGGSGSKSLNLLSANGTVVAGLSGSLGNPNFVVVNQNFSRVDGQPDNCGDNPGTPPRWEPTRPGPPLSPTVPFQPTNGPQITINVGSPSVRIDGTVNIPIDVGGIKVDGNAGSPTGASAPPPDGPDLENPGTPETPDPDENEKDSNSPLVCAIVRTTVIDAGRGSLILGDTERLYNPPLAFFRFKFNNGSASDWIEVTHPDQQICYSCCDTEADGFYVKWSFRCNGSVTPIRLKSKRE